MPAWQDGASLGRPSPLGCAGTRRSTQPRRHARESADGHGQRASASSHRPRWPKGWSDAAFAKVSVDFRGRVRDLLVWSHPVLWYSVDKVNLVLLAVVRDPERVMHERLLLQHRPHGEPRRCRLELRRALVDRVREPRGQAVPRRRGPPVLEASRTRTGRLIVAVALRGDMDLVHPDLRDLSDVDPPAVVSEEDHPELPRRARPAPPGPLGRTNYPHVISRATSRENPGRSARRPGHGGPEQGFSRSPEAQTSQRELRKSTVPDADDIFVITAYELTGKALQAYRRRRRRT